MVWCGQARVSRHPQLAAGEAPLRATEYLLAARFSAVGAEKGEQERARKEGPEGKEGAESYWKTHRLAATHALTRPSPRTTEP